MVMPPVMACTRLLLPEPVGPTTATEEGEWVDGWMGEWVGGWMGEWVGGWVSEWVGGWMDE